jgi:asparagine synthase (glutamine-hydrolysing)
MQQRLVHRGPDGNGLIVESNGLSGLAHTRLAVIDLSSDADQPMTSSDGRYTIVFNGEIYNFAKLRKELQSRGHVFRSRSDTEVVLQMFQAHGPDSVQKLQGMFAFAIWDRECSRWFLARDPLGIKPLYIWQSGESFAFASEVRALLAAELESPRVCPEALADYLLLGSVQEPRTLFQNVWALPAGHWMLWHDGRVHTSVYWQLQFGDDPVSAPQAVACTRRALDDSIQRHFVSDVPVGIFLSGGIDSTALVALAKANGYEDLQTFCISFDEHEFNEGGTARRTAEHFGSQHHDYRMTAREGQQLFEQFLGNLDQPSNDGFNTYCISKFARDSGLKVVLSGLGGDELFGGYPSFRQVPRLMAWRRRTDWTGPVLNLLARTIRRGASDFKAQRLAAFLASDGGPTAAYWAMRSFFTPAEVRRLVEYYTGLDCDRSDRELLSGTVPAQPTPQDIVGYLETTRYMRNQLLRDSDVMSMAHGLELRVPLVDRALVDQVGRIPAAIRYGPGKRLLLDAVPEIPAWVASQPKRGFRFPFDRWIGSEWSDQFWQLEQTSPVRLGNWYRRWTLFTLERCLQVYGFGNPTPSSGLRPPSPPKLRCGGEGTSDGSLLPHGR